MGVSDQLEEHPTGAQAGLSASIPHRSYSRLVRCPVLAQFLTFNPNTMSVPIFHLTELPIEILEQILLLYLPGKDIIKMEAVRWVIAIPHDSILTFCCTVKINRQFQSLTRDLPTLQYQRDLFFAGLTENPCNPCDFV